MPKALTIGAFGARGTGKTAWTIRQIKNAKPPRLLVWDFKNDPALEGVGQRCSSLPAMIGGAKAERFQIRYQVDHGRDIQAQFDLFCQAAWLAGNVMIMVDELPEVTKANKAPAAWRRVVNVGREYRGSDGKIKTISIIGVGQRPAECDKSFMTNLDVLHCGRLSHPADARKMADSLGCDFRQLMNLPDLHWIEKEAAKTTFSTGILTFSKEKKGVSGVRSATPKGRPLRD